MEDDGPGREDEPVDPEEVVRVMAQLREEHPDAKDSSLRRLISWDELVRLGETREAYAERMHGPVEPLP